jgi:dolichol-phosphate mannosyltransferase
MGKWARGSIAADGSIRHSGIAPRGPIMSVGMAAPPDTGSPEISIVVPAWYEAENIPALVTRTAAAVAPRTWEMLIVDDGSKDPTAEVVSKLAVEYPVRLIVRDHPEHGLSGAVLHGIAGARGSTIVVMDADLQHPPERLPDLLGALDQGADFALGSRYVPGGSTDAQWALFRKINSGVATLLARPFAGPVRDPMSGFFALRRSTFDRAERLTPLGYKIALELMCKCRVRSVKEVPIHFGLRTKGESKLSLKQQFRYLEHLSRLYDFTFPRASPIGKFAVTAGTGLVVGLGLFLLLTSLNVYVVASIAAGYLGVIAVTAVFHLRYVRTQRKFLVTSRPWGDFWTISVAETVVAAAVGSWAFRHTTGVWPFELFVIAFGCGLVTRYILRKEFLQDVRGLRRHIRVEDIVIGDLRKRDLRAGDGRWSK